MISMSSLLFEATKRVSPEVVAEVSSKIPAPVVKRLGLASKLPQKVHVATTDAEREAIYRFRYSVYVDELQKTVPEADHERRWIKDAEDDNPRSVLLYTGRPNGLRGTIRIDIWDPGQVPEKYFDMLDMPQFDGIGKATTSSAGRLIVHPDCRGTSDATSLSAAANRESIARGVDLVFLWCAPGLVMNYMRYGSRNYTNKLVRNPDGVRVPLVFLPRDLEHLKAVRSPFYGDALRAFGTTPAAPEKLFASVFERHRLAVQADATTTVLTLHDYLLDDNLRNAPMFRGLSDGDLLRLAKEGYVLDVAAGDLVFRQGLVEREMLVVLEGRFQFRHKGRAIAVNKPGDVSGYISFFHDAGQRTVDMRALVDSRLLVLRRKFLENIRKDDPVLASKLLFNLCRFMAKRIHDLIPRLLEEGKEARS